MVELKGEDPIYSMLETNPNVSFLSIGGSASANRQSHKKAAREFLLGDGVGPNSADLLASCDACGQ